MDALVDTWPWYVTGPLIVLVVPLLYFVSRKTFGISSSLKHVCAATVPGETAYFQYDWTRSGLGTFPGLVLIILGGLFIGFGARYAGGCTSGHGISGLANLQWPSLVAVAGFFTGGLFVTLIHF